MKTRYFLQRKPSILLWISIVAGFFVTSEEIMEYIERTWVKEIDPGTGSLSLLVFQCLFFILFTYILLQINVGWRPREKGHIRQLIYSLGMFVLFTVIVWIGVSPAIHTVNHAIREKYERKIQEEENRPSDKRKDKNRDDDRDAHFHGKKTYYLFHEPEEAWYNNLFTLFIVIYTLSRIYILAVRKEEVERNYEKLKNESLQSQIDALYNQINPHFFFNALNSLHALISTEGHNPKSVAYLSNLSEVFRYILQSEKKELVSLKDELAFLDTYRCMLAVKYEEKLAFDLQIDPACMCCQLPVLSLLPLIENVIKHNEISSRHPMRICIYSADGPVLMIRNRKQPKLDEVEKVGIGLKNLRNRFALLVGKEIHIQDSAEYFQVSLPLKSNPKSELS